MLEFSEKPIYRKYLQSVQFPLHDFYTKILRVLLYGDILLTLNGIEGISVHVIEVQNLKSQKDNLHEVQLQEIHTEPLQLKFANITIISKYLTK